MNMLHGRAIMIPLSFNLKMIVLSDIITVIVDNNPPFLTIIHLSGGE